MTSYIRNCYIQPREGEAKPLLGLMEGGTCGLRLDGYAVVPIEAWYAARDALKREAAASARHALQRAKGRKRRK